ncbi:MAG: GIY-YIG nuclease family protein [bacterium]|nr:GIY-YIG nuclease family protein [bacterium]
MLYFVYILKSLKDNRYYIGQTDNLEERINKHNRGEVKSTKSRIPFVLIKKEIFYTRSEARKRENYLKRLKGGNEFRKILEG